MIVKDNETRPCGAATEDETMLTTLTISGVSGLYDEDYLRSRYDIADDVKGLELQHAVNKRIALDAVNEERDQETGELIEY
jgi:hypothetical protein